MKEREEKRADTGKEGKLGMKAKENRERKEIEGREEKETVKAPPEIHTSTQEVGLV